MKIVISYQSSTNTVTKRLATASGVALQMHCKTAITADSVKFSHAYRKMTVPNCTVALKAVAARYRRVKTLQWSGVSDRCSLSNLLTGLAHSQK